MYENQKKNCLYDVAHVRFVWLVVVLAMIAWLIISIIKATVVLFQYPETSSISINHVPSMNFPAVTICNINHFRRNALEPRAVELLSKTFGNRGEVNSDLDLTNVKLFPNANQANLTEAIMSTAHRLEEMLHVCKWKSGPCSHLNFTRRLTDQGTCYTFNDPAEERDVLKVQYPGSKNGLFLRLNIQQDLYTYGETTSAGIKVGIPYVSCQA